jgi:hypothetical protein
MFIWRNYRIGGNCIAGIVLMLAVVPVGMCQTEPVDQTVSVVESESASSEMLEEITVYGDKSLTRLRHELYRAEEDFFDVFNDLNSTDEFDVDCDYVTILGDRRRHHLCMPKFAEKAEIDATLNMLVDGKAGGSWAEYYLGSVRVRKKDELLKAEIAALVTENPEMQEAFNNLVRANRAYESKRERR